MAEILKTLLEKQAVFIETENFSELQILNDIILSILKKKQMTKIDCKNCTVLFNQNLQQIKLLHRRYKRLKGSLLGKHRQIYQIQ